MFSNNSVSLFYGLLLVSLLYSNAAPLDSPIYGYNREDSDNGNSLNSVQFSHYPKFIGKWDIQGSSYCSVVQFSNTSSKDLFISAFAQPFISDRVYHIPKAENIKTYRHDETSIHTVGAENIINFGKTPDKLNGFITWPNEVTVGPADIFGQESVVVAGGWFVPTKTKGGIWYAKRLSNENSSMSDWIPVIEKKGWFYHRVLYYDMDKDGQDDIVSCRVHKPYLADFGFGKAQGSLVYLTREPINTSKFFSFGGSNNNKKNNQDFRWVEHEVNEHCDVFFRMEDLDGDGHKEIIAAEFFNQRLSITYSEHPEGRFDLKEFVKIRVIEDKLGQMFDVEYKDLNGDGIKDFLVSTHQEKGEEVTGAVYGYEFDSKEFKSTEFKRHTLMKDFEVISNAPKEASPGQAQAFMITGNSKPWVIVAGDGSWKAHLLRPLSDSPDDWDYQETILHDCKMTVGGISVHDLNGDGLPEVIIPCFDLGKGNTVIYEFQESKRI